MEEKKIFDQEIRQEERIMRYLQGAMDATEEAAFMEEMWKDAALKEKVVVTARLAKAMKEVGQQKDEEVRKALLASNQESIKTIVDSISGREDDEYDCANIAAPTLIMREEFDKEPAAARVAYKPAAVVSFRRKLLYISSIAASIIFIVFIGFQYKSYSDITGLGDEYGMEFNTSSLLRGESNEKVEKELSILFLNISEGDNLDETIERLTLLWELSGMEVYNDYTDYNQEIGWNLTIAHLKNNDKKLAKTILEKLIDSQEQETAMTQKAQELLDRINNL